MSTQITDHTDVPSGNARYYYFATQYRRSALWVILGVLLILPLLWYVDPPKGQPWGVAEKIGGISVFALFPIWMVQYLFARVRVDDRGISRRILWWWDLWSWEAFTDGQIEHGMYLSSYEFPGRVWWRQKLILGYLTNSAAKEINGLIQTLLKVPAPKPLPDSIEIQLKPFKSELS